MEVYVHGGVGGAPAESHDLAYALAPAVRAHSAIDAVEISVRALEDDPELNAGFGSVLSRAGTLELDAGIADGATGRFGGVMAVNVSHPISLARQVMERSPHVLMTGSGAMALAPDMDVLIATSERQIQRWKKGVTEGFEDPDESPEEGDTVGAVARDDEGRLAAGSSTGGVFGKLSGRVGDAPIFGAGVYASRGAAVVGTGTGEAFLRDLAAARTGFLIEQGAHPQEACAEIVALLGRDRPFLAALLAIDGQGAVGAAFRGGHIWIEGRNGPLEARAIP